MHLHSPRKASEHRHGPAGRVLDHLPRASQDTAQWPAGEAGCVLGALRRDGGEAGAEGSGFPLERWSCPSCIEFPRLPLPGVAGHRGRAPHPGGPCPAPGLRQDMWATLHPAKISLAGPGAIRGKGSFLTCSVPGGWSSSGVTLRTPDRA